MAEKRRKTIVTILACGLSFIVAFVVSGGVVYMIVNSSGKGSEGSGFAVGMFLGGAMAGMVCGLLPYFVGKKKGNGKLGGIGFFSCIGAGLILGLLLALPVAIVFTVVIIVKADKSSKDEDEVQFIDE